jgi:hypothetical protein
MFSVINVAEPGYPRSWGQGNRATDCVLPALVPLPSADQLPRLMVDFPATKPVSIEKQGFSLWKKFFLFIPCDFCTQVEHSATVSFPRHHWGTPADHPVPVGSEVIVRRDGSGEIVTPTSEEAKKLTPEVGIVMGVTKDGDYMVGLLKAKEVVSVPIEHVSVSLNRFQGPTQYRFEDFGN